MELEKIQMPVEKAKEEWKKYTELIKTRREKYLKDMKSCMYELKQGKELIDIWKVMEKIGLNKNYEPKMAIARADWKEVIFIKQDAGRGFFSDRETSWSQSSEGHIDIKPNTFMEWPRVKEEREVHGTKNKVKIDGWQIVKDKIKTKVPIIPAQLLPDSDIKGFYILWEVDHWEDLPKKEDPILLKRITENLFVILGAWDVTELEQSVISGL